MKIMHYAIIAKFPLERRQSGADFARMMGFAGLRRGQISHCTNAIHSEKT